MNAAPILFRFRLIARAEGISFLVLLFIAMPLKHVWDMPLAVKYVGWAHGLLFIGYWAAAVPLFSRLNWATDRLMGLGAASVLPFGTFVMERKWLNGQS